MNIEDNLTEDKLRDLSCFLNVRINKEENGELSIMFNSRGELVNNISEYYGIPLEAAKDGFNKHLRTNFGDDLILNFLVEKLDFHVFTKDADGGFTALTTVIPSTTYNLGGMASVYYTDANGDEQREVINITDSTLLLSLKTNSDDWIEEEYDELCDICQTQIQQELDNVNHIKGKYFLVEFIINNEQDDEDEVDMAIRVVDLEGPMTELGIPNMGYGY